MASFVSFDYKNTKRTVSGYGGARGGGHMKFLIIDRKKEKLKVFTIFPRV